MFILRHKLALENMGTVDNIFVLNGLNTHCINENKYLYCCFVDFTKAFDYIDRDILWYKLIKIGVRGQMLNIMIHLQQCKVKGQM